MGKLQPVVQQEFDSLAAEYETNRLARWYAAHSDEIIRHCPELTGGDILDIGCASGYFVRQMSKKCPESRVVGVDVSPKMIKEAKRKAIAEECGETIFLNDDWENMTEESLEILRRFDFRLIVCANAFHYFRDVRKASEIMYNLLSERGALLVLEREKLNSPLTSLWDFLHRHFIKDQVRFYDTGELVQLFENIGFEDVNIVKTIRRYFWKGKVFTSIALIKCNKGTGAG